MFIQLGYTRSCRVEFKLGSQLRKNRDFLLLMYVNEPVTKQSMGRRLDCFCKGIQLYMAFTQSHRPEEAILDSYDKHVSGFIDIGNYHLIFLILYQASSMSKCCVVVLFVIALVLKLQ